MAITKSEIVSRALVKLGARPVTNLEDDLTPESETMLNLYTIALESLLCETLWTFATKRVLLTLLAEDPVWSNEKEVLQFVYLKPIDSLRIFETNDTAAYWREEAGKILSDTAGLGVKYVFRNENTATYPTYFALALSDKLAMDAAYPILNSNSKTQDMMQQYERISLPKAKSENAQIGTPKTLNDDYWVNSRYGGPNMIEFS